MRSNRLFVGPIEQNVTLVHLSHVALNSRMIEQARDFESPAALANHLLAVDLDPEAYAQYHAWRKRPLRELNPRLAHRLLAATHSPHLNPRLAHRLFLDVKLPPLRPVRILSMMAKRCAAKRLRLHEIAISFKRSSSHTYGDS